MFFIFAFVFVKLIVDFIENKALKLNPESSWKNIRALKSSERWLYYSYIVSIIHSFILIVLQAHSAY